MKYRGGANSLIAILLIGFLALVLLMGIGLVGRARTGERKLTALNVAADAAWAEVETALQPRFDLIPGLVETARPYATADQEMLDHLIEARKKYSSAGTPDAKVDAANEVERLLTQLLALQDKNAQLKANETFRALTVALQATEPAVAAARARYNDAIRVLNDYTNTPFTRRLVQKANIHPRPYLQPPGQLPRSSAH
jgi:LemA protein